MEGLHAYAVVLQLGSRVRRSRQNNPIADAPLIVVGHDEALCQGKSCRERRSDAKIDPRMRDDLPDTPEVSVKIPEQEY